MTQIEVDEVLRLYSIVSIVEVSTYGHHFKETIPCVTKLPKFLPTMQCHVAPLRSSNCVSLVEARRTRTAGDMAYCPLNVVSDLLDPSQLELSSRLTVRVHTFSMLNFSIAS